MKYSGIFLLLSLICMLMIPQTYGAPRELPSLIEQYNQHGWPWMNLGDWLVILKNLKYSLTDIQLFIENAARHPQETGVTAHGKTWLTYRNQFRLLIEVVPGSRRVHVTNMDEHGQRFGGPVSKDEEQQALQFWERRLAEYRRALYEERRRPAKKSPPPQPAYSPAQTDTYLFPAPWILLLCNRPGFECTGLASPPNHRGPHGRVPKIHGSGALTPLTRHPMPKGTWRHPDKP